MAIWAAGPPKPITPSLRKTDAKETKRCFKSSVMVYFPITELTTFVIFLPKVMKEGFH